MKFWPLPALYCLVQLLGKLSSLDVCPRVEYCAWYWLCQTQSTDLAEFELCTDAFALMRAFPAMFSRINLEMSPSKTLSTAEYIEGGLAGELTGSMLAQK